MQATTNGLTLNTVDACMARVTSIAVNTVMTPTFVADASQSLGHRSEAFIAPTAPFLAAPLSVVKRGVDRVDNRVLAIHRSRPIASRAIISATKASAALMPFRWYIAPAINGLSIPLREYAAITQAMALPSLSRGTTSLITTRPTTQMAALDPP